MAFNIRGVIMAKLESLGTAAGDSDYLGQASEEQIRGYKKLGEDLNRIAEHVHKCKLNKDQSLSLSSAPTLTRK